MSKGSQPRPYSVDQKTFNQNWDSIFKKSQTQEREQQKEKDNKDELDKSN